MQTVSYTNLVFHVRIFGHIYKFEYTPNIDLNTKNANLVRLCLGFYLANVLRCLRQCICLQPISTLTFGFQLISCHRLTRSKYSSSALDIVDSNIFPSCHSTVIKFWSIFLASSQSPLNIYPKLLLEVCGMNKKMFS